jgi:hypothetical protein
MSVTCTARVRRAACRCDPRHRACGSVASVASENASAVKAASDAPGDPSSPAAGSSKTSASTVLRKKKPSQRYQRPKGQLNDPRLGLAWGTENSAAIRPSLMSSCNSKIAQHFCSVNGGLPQSWRVAPLSAPVSSGCFDSSSPATRADRPAGWDSRR